ncbi:unnamed protein product, partial [Lepidochelys olivacea]
MYFLLASLPFLDVRYSSVNAPKLLLGLLSQCRTILFNECTLQMFFFHFIAGAMVGVLMVMAAVRYVAIYKPLRYLIIMNHGVCMGLVARAWLGRLAHSAVQIGLILQLPFCGPNILNNFYRHVPQIIKLACMDTYLVDGFQSSSRVSLCPQKEKRVVGKDLSVHPKAITATRNSAPFHCDGSLWVGTNSEGRVPRTEPPYLPLQHRAPESHAGALC